ncbi:MAG: glycosyltransferase [Acidimicrobiia bacterium]
MERATTPNLERGRRGRSPRAVVVHTTDGTFRGAKAWFEDPASGVSAHYLVSLGGEVVQFVDEEDTAWHAGMEPAPGIPVLGDDPPNLCTIGVEFADERRPHDIERPDEQYEAGALLLAGIARRWGIPLDTDHVIAHRRINPQKTCPANLDVDELVELAAVFAEVEAHDAPHDAPRPRLVVMVPARNAANDLPRFLASVERFADAVVALDDGSTDDTAAVLDAHPLVERLLRNPVRATYAGWDDGANRARLLDAAREVGADWVLSLDADECITADDAAALRVFVDTDALPELAYGFECHRMWGDGCDPRPSFVYRLFAPTPASRFASGRLHFDPVPADLPVGRQVRTTLRIQHWGSADEAARLARIEKYQEADPAGEYATGFGGVDDVPEEVVPWLPRDPALPVVTDRRRRGDGAAPHPRLVVMVPARNAAADLPGFLDNVSHFADAVVALDDGSTDDTAAILEAHPLVRRLLRNERRETYEGWDDAANRNRLLEVAAELDPEWLLALDADERIPLDDADALLDFLATDALPGCAYGMRCHRMIDDLDHYDTADLWVYRLFAHQEGQRFPDTRLHFVPVPESIPRPLWLQTTIRIQHLASLTEERREARFDKYREADPDVEFQAGYDHLLRAPEEVHRFGPRPPGLPVLVGAPDAVVDVDATDLDAPALSAVVISRNDESRIARTVRSVVEQECEEPFEVIVVTSGTDRTAAIVREQFPGVRVVELDHAALPGEARNAGLRFARGSYVSFPGSHVSLAPGSLAARIRAHDAGWTMVTGTTTNGTDTPAGWAAFFLDHSDALPGRGSVELTGPPSSCSYDRRSLVEVGGFPEDVRAGEDTTVNNLLWQRGGNAFRAADISLVHHNRCATPRRLVEHHFGRGRALTQVHRWRGIEPARLRTILRTAPRRRIRRIDGNVDRWGGELRDVYRRRRRLVVAGVLAANAGSWWEYVRPSRVTPPRPAPAPRRNAPVAYDGPLAQPLRVRRDPAPPFAGHRAVFVHLPKTAGSTFLRIIEREYGEEAVYRLYGGLDARLAELRARSVEEQRAVRVVAGHVAMGVAEELPGPSAYLTIVRDPVERIVSHYHYVRSRPDGQGHARALEGIRTLEDYVTKSVFAGMVNNGQTRLLGSDLATAGQPATAAVLDRALATLARTDVIVGVQERFDELVLLACRAFGWGWPAYGRDNVGVGRPRLAQVPEATVELIRDRNQLDVALHEAARARVERDLAAVPDLDELLATVRLAARGPRPD